MKIEGTFSIEMKPLESYAKGLEGVQLGRMSIDKVFSGVLKATSKGEMLSAMCGKGAGYVAIEQVEGVLDGKKGTFVLQHFGTMLDAEDTLILEVVPDSATGALCGLVGKMGIVVKDSQHHYTFDYTYKM